ncbi:unnamed protein product [Protopolystoma xenopodis]|uniref:Uncharacterized protein n=1 Tax=Protopolystoma xenopodis TaxID=117903 RepID=A0A3S5AMX4_9PLAT|nr:unnamed protein product [Protopolystoma xenopodis]
MPPIRLPFGRLEGSLRVMEGLEDCPMHPPHSPSREQVSVIPSPESHQHPPTGVSSTPNTECAFDNSIIQTCMVNQASPSIQIL